jgi:hypothetical protein
MRMSFIYTTITVLVKYHKISSIIVIKFAGAFFKPKGMTNHSKRPYFDLKAVFHTYVYSIGTWWYPYFRSILLKYFSPIS